MGRRILLLISIGALFVACGGGRPFGYGGPPIANAVQTEVRPVLVYTGHGASRARPFLYTKIVVSNVISFPVRIHGCLITAVNDDGQQIFLRGWAVAPDTLLRPGQRIASMEPASYGERVTYARAPSLHAVRAVTRYEVSCDVFAWVGPLPDEED